MLQQAFREIGLSIGCRSRRPDAELPYTAAVRLLEALAFYFINTFGITQPTEQTRRRAAWFIFGLIVLMLGGVSAVGYAFYAAMHR